MSDFWEQPEAVERFARRDPDHRLLRLVDRHLDPSTDSVLDVGCAGGRNAELLARLGFDVHALDTSSAMVEETRARVARHLGEAEAERRVRRGPMDALPYADDSFDLVVALGVYHNAADRSEWDRAISETARVLRAGGLLLLSEFSPDTDLHGEGMPPVPGAPDTFEGPHGRMVLLDADAVDAGLAAHGLEAEVPTEVVRVDLDPGRRVSVNGLYRMRSE
ncbi:MAG: class I SAM-dependent methyltransferase [Gemmatimonadota bacterium]